MAIKNIIFDWSGTLSDDFTPVYQASMMVFKKLGKEPISMEEYRREFTLPYMVFWNKYFPDLRKEEEDKLYIEAIHQVDEPTIYQGVKKELERLKSLGINMIVISSHPHDKLLKEAKDYGVQSFFQEINGSIHDKTETILDILHKNNFDSNQTMYVGDMTHDIDAGKKAGVVTVALGWGYQSEEVLKGSSPDHYIKTISNLDQLL
jgi:phosphoglycolate phosphatase